MAAQLMGLHRHVSARCDADGCKEILFLGSYADVPDDFTNTLESLGWRYKDPRYYCPAHLDLHPIQ